MGEPMIRGNTKFLVNPAQCLGSLSPSCPTPNLLAVTSLPLHPLRFCPYLSTPFPSLQDQALCSFCSGLLFSHPFWFFLALTPAHIPAFTFPECCGHPPVQIPHRFLVITTEGHNPKPDIRDLQNWLHPMPLPYTYTVLDYPSPQMCPTFSQLQVFVHTKCKSQLYTQNAGPSLLMSLLSPVVCRLASPLAQRALSPLWLPPALGVFCLAGSSRQGCISHAHPCWKAIPPTLPDHGPGLQLQVPQHSAHSKQARSAWLYKI